MKLKAVSGITLTLLFIGMLTLAFNIQLIEADTNTIYVDDDNTTGPWDGTPEHPYQSITSALDHASVNGTIYVYNGTYYENVIVNKNNLTLVGENKDTTIIHSLEEKPTVNITADDVTIRGFTIENGWEGIRIAGKGNVVIDNIITHLPYSAGAVIYLQSGSRGNTLSNNVICEPWCGIVLFDSSFNTISSNNITMGGVGIFVSSLSSYNTISNNRVAYGDLGLRLQGDDTHDNLVANNTLLDNKLGISLIRCYGNVIYHNNFIDNTQQADISMGYPPHRFWDDGYPSGGNYWSDYNGVDVKSGPNKDQPSSDGIGDTAYVIDVQNPKNRDRYPLMYPWGTPPPPSYTLTIHSSPTGMPFTVTDISRTTSWSGTYSEGALVSLVMPDTHDGYDWSHWLEDGDPNRIKTVTMDTNITLTGVFTPVPPPPPVGGKAIPIDKPIIKPELQIPWIWLTTIILSLVLTVVYVKKRKRNTRTLFT